MDKGKIIDFDGIFQYIGSMGMYQILMFLVLTISSFTGAEVIFNNFVGYIPNHWCYVDELEDLPHDVQKNVASPIKTDSLGNIVFNPCKYYDLNYSHYTDEQFLKWNRSEHISNNTNAIGCDHGWIYDQSVVASSISTKWDLVCTEEWKVQLISTIFVAGYLAGSLILGPISDRFGRRVGIAVFSFLKIASTYLSALSPLYSIMAAANFFMGVGSIGNYVLCYTTLIEIVGPSVRPQVGMGYTIVYGVGFTCVAGFGYAVRDVTNLQLVRAGSASLLILAWWFIPESPRWLLLNKRDDEAEKMIKRIAQVNGKDLPKDFDIKCIRAERENKSKGNLIDVFRNQIMRKRSLILCLHWFTDSLIVFALSLNSAGLSGDVYINTLLLGAIEIPASISAIFFMKCRRIGRRGTAFLSLALAGVSCLICVPLIITQVAPDAVTVFSLLGKAGSTMGFNSMYLYSSELFPTDVRDVGIGMCSFAARVSGMAAPFVGGPLGDVWAPLPNVIFGSLSIVTAFLSLLLPETLGTPLPDNIQMAEEQERTRKKGLSQLPSTTYGTKDTSNIGIQNKAFDEDLNICL